MNWEAIGAVGEILGALAVVATLFYLAVQVRENTRVARAETTKDLYLASRTAIMDIAANEELNRAWTEIMGFRDEASGRRFAFLQSFFRLYELQHALSLQGLLDERIAGSYDRIIQVFGATPQFGEYWERARPQFNPEFARRVDELLESVPFDSTD